MHVGMYLHRYIITITPAPSLLDDGIRFLEVELLEEERDSLGTWRRIAVFLKPEPGKKHKKEIRGIFRALNPKS